MYNQLLLSLAVSTVPILAFAFVGLLLLHKLYVKIRSNFDVSVNCWFCNQYTRVPYLESNSWTCPHCEQYNGFTKDGDYNRDIFSQMDCSNSSSGIARLNQSSEHDSSNSALCAPKNGFCNECNEAQRLKVEKLAQFEPKRESRFDEELKAFKVKLEQQYRLCGTCERHLGKVLHEKKKMVLGSKFLDFIIKGAETLKQPHFSQVRHVQCQHWKRRLALHITLLTIINLFCLFCMLPTLTREHLTSVLGERVGEQLFLAISHVLALCRVLIAYLTQIGAHPLLEKCKLFSRTIFMMLMYSLGLKMPQITRISFSSLYVLAYPFVLLGISFGYKMIDGFKLTRFTFLLTLWSAFAGGLIDEQLYFSPNILMLIASTLTLVLSLTNEVEVSPKLHDNSTTSFHKIYSEDYLSDDDTISMLSQQFNCSSASTVRSPSIRGRPSPQQKAQLYKTPVTSSTLSLHNATNTKVSPNSTNRSSYFDLQPSAHSVRSHYAASTIGDFHSALSSATLTARAPFFGSNLDINNVERARSPMFGQSGNNLRNGLNASVLNASFSGESNAHLTMQKNGFYGQQRIGGPISQRNFSGNSGGLHSPFSLSSNTVYQRPASTNLITPSRFSTTCIAQTPATSWLSTGSLNQLNKNFPEPRQTMTTIGENLSRASSQSSGFESQNDRLNMSRENSFSNESNDNATHPTASEATRSFQPIDAGSRSAFSPRPSLLTNPQLVTPLTVNCGLTSPAASQAPSMGDLWAAPAQRKGLGGLDIFNLRKINDELPLPTHKYKRGDLLKKWKESQLIS
ncbi:uncharacterized protein LOC105225550 [Bactrocera dorsalis]|uniref:Uncharacterized protein LOC105225550 n=1 Tax=Bactrocera dorsalis TaxID=27457 RepID=A0A6I9V1U3_BACDO|nr:uncharacterized protein LOC105225550 [Bactrocera dorsalis]